MYECVYHCMPYLHTDFENGLVHFLCPLTAKFDSWKNNYKKKKERKTWSWTSKLVSYQSRDGNANFASRLG